ncbi:GNAT family N-acetyltransferase [Pseudomonas protegens]|jgi:GNAT superfamily N-acetyltransferase|uniref:Acetyltransferase, GNAT family n=3 Tax=Pseudomonas protegens TaxID=380021 RepID=Q4KDY8_PSEF5|nr:MULTISPECIES: GNAT family N-acetyltransferase [Pseudomonas]AAY91711.1 acetyltransferase, GNAT family [Pseudomonas protegens Pf-5]AGL84269.1 acetyltransferase, GNAT family [Pseudomonas protegens CHA0]ASE24052.1 N-acetyltransferase [Pseudomonas protegens]MBB1612949.1 GNAT family acetyltransferase [Pseudomonas sp. UMC65]MBB1623454.1 GNAT family acetyltransferase [Pseudomonas sp. UME65]
MSDQQPAVTVRAIQPGDYQQWLPLWLAYQDFYQVTLSEEVSRRTFERFLDSREPMYSAVAVQGDEVIGFVNLVLHRSTWAVGDFCYLEDLYVAPSIRGSGAGKLLIEWVQAFARQHQCARLYWHTQESNKRAQRLYDWVAHKPGVIEYRMEL